MVSEARKQSTVWMETDYPKRTPYSKMAATRKKLARVARKRGHKGQIGWNKNKKVNQFTLQNNCHFSSLSNLFSSPQNMQNSTKTTLGPYDLIFVQLAPVFPARWPFWNEVYSVFSMEDKMAAGAFGRASR